MKPNLFHILAIATGFNLTVAGDVITPTAATSTTWQTGGNRVITKTIDGSGLSDISDPASELDDAHPYVSNTDSPYWLNNGAVSAEVVEFNLGGPHDISGVHYWKYTRDASRNIKTFDISFSTDGGTTFSTPVAAASLNMADWSQSLGNRGDSYAELRTFDTLSGITDIRFSNIQVYGGSLIGLHEIRFEGVSAGTVGPVDADESMVVAFPAAVLADGASAATITVTLKDASGFPVAGEDVVLSNTSGPGTPVIGPSGTQTTDGSGVAIFTVSSGTVGTEGFTATSATDSVVVTQTASVEFQGLVVDADTSTVSASLTEVPANGIKSSTIRVTLRNAGGLPLPGKPVSLTGDSSAIIDPAGTATTDASGVATFTVSSGTAGLETFTATSESVTITATAGVDFTEIPTGDVITPVAATSTSTVGSPRTIDKAIDGSGLSDVLDPASVLDDYHVYDGTAYWLSADGAVSSGTEELTFDLGGTFEVDTVYYWTYEREGDRNLRTSDFLISVENDLALFGRFRRVGKSGAHGFLGGGN